VSSGATITLYTYSAKVRLREKERLKERKKEREKERKKEIKKKKQTKIHIRSLQI